MTTIHDIPGMDLDELAERMLEPPRDFGRGDDRLFETHAFSPVGGTHRDDDAIGKSNHRAILKALQEEFPDDVEEGSCGHWAVGWTAPIIVRVKHDDGTLNEPLLRRIQEIAGELESYPVFDEEDYLELEHEEKEEAVESWLSHELRDMTIRLLAYGDDDLDIATETAVWDSWDTQAGYEAWHAVEDITNHYLEPDGSGYWIDMDKVEADLRDDAEARQDFISRLPEEVRQAIDKARADHARMKAEAGDPIRLAKAADHPGQAKLAEEE